MRKFSPLTELFAVSAIVLACHPDTAQAQQLFFVPDQPNVVLNITGPGGVDSKSTVATSKSGDPTAAVSSITVASIATQPGSGNWLCATASGATLTVSTGGTGCPSTQLNPNTPYNGTVVVNSPGFSQRTLQVILNVGTSTGGSVGLVANPSSVNLSSTTPTSQTVNISYYGAATTIISVTTSGQSWLSANIPFTGSSSVTVNVNPIGLSGTNTGTVNVNTSAGSLSIPVTFTLGTTSGFSTSPSPVTFTLPAGSASQSQTVSTFYNGAPLAVSSFNTTSGQNWIQVNFTSGFNSTSLLVTAFPQNFSGTFDTATVTISTPNGTFSFPVTLTIGSGSSAGLTVSPNPLVLSAALNTPASSQNVSVFYNGTLTAISSVSATTVNGVAWLSATNPNNTGQVSVTDNPSLLGAGTYTGNVIIVTQFGQVNLSVTLSVGAGSSSGLVITPSALTFNIPLVGAGTAPQSVNVTFNGVPVAIQSATNATSGQNWLLLSSPSTGTVTVGINGASLTQGTYSATVTVNTESGSANFQVTLNVATGAASGFVSTPNPVQFNVQVGSSSSTQNVSVSYNGSPATINSVTATPSSGQNWLQASTSTVAGSVTVTVTPSALVAGNYSGTVTVNTVTGTTSFTVNLTVGGATPGLTASPNSLSFTAAVGGTAPSQNVNITANGVPATITSVSATTTTGQNWVQASTSSTGVVTVSVTPSILAAGSYTGTVTVNTTSGTTSFQVNLTVGSGGTSGSGLTASPSPVIFNVAAAGQNPTQNVSVTGTSGAQVAITSFTFAAVPVLGPNFLNIATNADGTLTLTVNNVVTNTGVYQGTLTLYTSAGSVAVPVTLNLGTGGGGGGGGGGLLATPSTLTFNAQVGGSAPAQNVSITLNGTAIAVTGVTGSANWLSPSVTSGVVGGVTVGVNTAGLSQTTYSGTVTVTTASGTLSIQVTLQVGGTPPTTSPTIVVTPSSLSPISFQVGGSSPQPLTLNVSLQGGGATGFTAGSTGVTGGDWLAVSPPNGTTPGTVTITINPAGLVPNTYTGFVSIAIPLATNSPVRIPISLTVTPAPVIKPAVVAVQNAASTLPTSISPGLNILIFGSNMGPATITAFQVSSNGTLATTVAGTQVTFDGTAAPIIFTSANLVSVMVPYEIANKVTTAIVVTYNSVASDPVNLRVVASAPGIYTVNQSGSGQGAILNQNGTVNSANNPEAAGNVIQIFATGEGVTTPAGATGALVPNRLPLPRPALPVTVNIGGIDVPESDITYVGEAPGLVSGIIQIDARIPAGVGPGAAPVVIRIGGVPSQSNVTVSVR